MPGGAAAVGLPSDTPREAGPSPAVSRVRPQQAANIPVMRIEALGPSGTLVLGSCLAGFLIKLKASERRVAALQMSPDSFHGEWNPTLLRDEPSLPFQVRYLQDTVFERQGR
jgi:hypothetical protein